MTIRVRQHILPLDQERLASIVTMAVLNPADDDEAVPAGKAGTAWVRWGDTQKLPEPTPRLD